MRLSYLYIVYCLCTIRSIRTDTILFEDDIEADCNSASTCVVIYDCKPAIQEIRTIGQNASFKACGFRKNTPLVCCPNSVLKPPQTPPPTKPTSTEKVEVKLQVTSRSGTACDKYAKALPANVRFQIAGGEDAEAGEFPHMGALGYLDEEGKIRFACGGTLISERYVLTAAHCIFNQQANEPVVVRFGKLILEGDKDNLTAYDYDVESTKLHEQYSRKKHMNDIGLLKLKKPVEFSASVAPACLYTEQQNPNQTLIITGWGTTEAGGQNSEVLQKADVRAITRETCQKSFESESQLQKTNIRDTHICATAKNIDACPGDSGGPLAYQGKNRSAIYTLVGVTSFGRGCGGTYPGIYTRVSSYIEWIEDIVWP